MKYIKSFSKINEMKLTPMSLINQIVDPSFINRGISDLEKELHNREDAFSKLSPEEAEEIVEEWQLSSNLIKISKASGTPNEILLKASKWLYEIKKEIEKELDCRKLVLSNISYKNLSNYKAPKDIRIDVLRTLPNRKDIIQLTPNRVIKYIKTNTFLSVETSWDYGDTVESYFFCIDLISGITFYNDYDSMLNAYDKKIPFDENKRMKYEDMVEKYYSEFITCVTYIELTDVTFDICYSNSSRGNIMKGTDLKNQLPYNVIQVNSHWNATRVHIGDTFGVIGHWRLAPVGPTGNKKYKYILIEPYEKTGIIKRKAGKNIHNKPK